MWRLGRGGGSLPSLSPHLLSPWPVSGSEAREPWPRAGGGEGRGITDKGSWGGLCVCVGGVEPGWGEVNRSPSPGASRVPSTEGPRVWPALGSVWAWRVPHSLPGD